MTRPPAVRNGLPETPGYAIDARGRRDPQRPRYPWAQRVLAAAEAVHGPPVPTCVCGARPIRIRQEIYPADGLCAACRTAAP